MPLQNRVTPFGKLVATASRGTMLGNRGGMFHDPATRTLAGRRWATRGWLCCSLSFSGSHRHPVWSRGYTQLFFLDEATALSAGHRPCAECRRPAAMAYAEAVGQADGTGRPRLAALDGRLHAERLDGRAQRRHPRPAAELPDGAMVADGDRALLLLRGRALPWSPDGYGAPEPRQAGEVMALTPPTTLAALAAGYRPQLHPSAA